MFENIKALIADAKGAPSSMRVLSFLVITDVMLVWTYLCISTGVFITLSYDMILLILGVLGVKAYQRKIEENDCGKS